MGGGWPWPHQMGAGAEPPGLGAVGGDLGAPWGQSRVLLDLFFGPTHMYSYLEFKCL